MVCDCITAADKRILVAGSNGLIGAKVVETLLEYGFFNLRCFVRRSSQLGRLSQSTHGQNIRSIDRLCRVAQ